VAYFEVLFQNSPAERTTKLYQHCPKWEGICIQVHNIPDITLCFD